LNQQKKQWQAAEQSKQSNYDALQAQVSHISWHPANSLLWKLRDLSQSKESSDKLAAELQGKIRNLEEEISQLKAQKEEKYIYLNNDKLISSF
jgi:phage shock protein A